jgi:hypothetical protein
VVAIRPHSDPESPVAPAEAARLAYLLDRSDTREVDLLDFLVTVTPILFPEADPTQRPDIPRGAVDLGIDLMFRLRERPSIGIVEIKTSRTAVRTGRQISRGIEMALTQVRHFLERRPTEKPIEVAYVIAGRRGTGSGVAIGHVQEPRVPVPIHLWSWDDVVERLRGSDDDRRPAFEVVLVEIVDLSRRLLRALLAEPALLTGIDDRKFEEMVATLLFDLGLQDVELTPLRKDGGRDIIASHEDPVTGDHSTYLIECKHWVSGNKVTLRWALSLLDVANRQSATGAVLLSSSGFGPRLLEQEATLETKGLLLRDSRDLHRWLHVWERQYGSVLVQPVDPMVIFGGARSGD